MRSYPITDPTHTKVTSNIAIIQLINDAHRSDICVREICGSQ
jgi:hypothetical protein